MFTRRAFVLAPVCMALPFAADARKGKGKRKKGKDQTKADSAIPLLRDLAAHHMHSVRDEGTPIADLVAQYRRGETLHVICGSISAVAAQLLREAGYDARVVGVQTREAFYGDDGHIMVEVWDDGAWRLYDIDGNRRAVDSRGRGVSIVAQVAAGSGRLWESLANDPPTAPEFEPRPDDWLPLYSRAWDARVFGTPWLQQPDAWTVFQDDADRARMEAQGHRYVTEKAWQRLLGKP